MATTDNGIAGAGAGGKAAAPPTDRASEALRQAASVVVDARIRVRRPERIFRAKTW